MQPKLSEIVETMKFLPDWEERYRYIIDLGRKIPAYPDEYRTEAYSVKGCTSQVWMKCDVSDGKFGLIADSDAHIVKGLIAILQAAYSGTSVQEVGQVNITSIFAEMELSAHLSPNRRNGFFAMAEAIHKAARLDENASA